MYFFNPKKCASVFGAHVFRSQIPSQKKYSSLVLVSNYGPFFGCHKKKNKDYRLKSLLYGVFSFLSFLIHLVYFFAPLLSVVIGFRAGFSVKFRFFFGEPNRKTGPFDFRLKPKPGKPEASVFGPVNRNRKFWFTDNTRQIEMCVELKKMRAFNIIYYSVARRAHRHLIKKIGSNHEAFKN